MLEHYVDMVVAADPSLQSASPEQQSAVRAMKKAVRIAEPTFSQVATKCETEVTRKEYDCSRTSRNPDEWQACIE
jgi:TPP-dependent indolepyruvate ferredoxin oxidoreductase alpha subunit